MTERKGERAVIRGFLLRIGSRLAGTLAALALVASPAAAQQRISFIRDAEVENTIRVYATPLFAAAGLDPSGIDIHLVNDRQLNAFVANGLNMFMNTGLLVRAEHAGQVVGVIAHETGHIAGGHLARLRDGMSGAMTEAIVAMVLGAAVGMATGRGDAGMAVMSGGMQVAERGILKYSRDMESSADQAGTTFLERSGTSAKGLAEFLELIADQELMSSNRQDPYVRTHPISRERVEFVRNFLIKSRFANAPLPPQYDELHRRMRAKLQGYLEPARALNIYKESDPSLEARYARAIAYSRRPEYERALALMDSVLRERPDDGYFLEAKAQMLLEAGRVNDALPLYARSVEVLPNEPLIRTALAHVQIETNRPQLLQQAIVNLERARQKDPEYGETWRLLAVAYGRDGQVGMAQLAQAEHLTLRGKSGEARAFAERAQRSLPPNSPAWQRAEDIKNANDPKEKK
jgi:predicted Zn-dependent protease